MQNSPKVNAQIDSVSTFRGACVGVANSKGTVSINKCTCNTGNPNGAGHDVIVQNIEDTAGATVVADDTCSKVMDVSSEFAMFGREFEVRLVNDGLYEVELPDYTVYIVPLVILIAVLFILLPICHSTMLKLLLTSMSKRKTN